MTQIVLIGAGKLGSRHLQALSKLKTIDTKLHVVDKSKESLLIAKKRLAEVKGSKLTHNANFYRDINDLNLKEINLLILATTAENRLDILNQLVKKTKIRNLILEKFLFQKEKDFYKADEVLKKNKIKTWVNCPRRQWDFYKTLKKNLQKEKIIEVKVDGAMWSMATSAIHFIDLISFLIDEKSYEVSKTNFGKSFVPSYSIITGPRQSTFIEFFGRIKGKFKNATSFSFFCTKKNRPFLITIQTASKRIEIYEELGRCVFFDLKKLNKIKEVFFTMPYQSEITNLIAEDIISRNDCSLTAYEESMGLHLPLLKSYLKYLSKISSKNTTKCPIT